MSENGLGGEPGFKRILIKLSGEALMGKLDFGTDPAEVERIARQLVATRNRGVEIAIVVGAGNIYRGIDGAAQGMDRATGDYMGMMATVLNALTLQDALEKHGQYTRVLSAIDVREVAEPYIRRRAMRHLEKGRIVIFAAGTHAANEDRMLSHPALAGLTQTRRERLDPALLWCGGPTIPRLAERLALARTL